jgi:hypothetical protein
VGVIVILGGGYLYLQGVADGILEDTSSALDPGTDTDADAGVGADQDGDGSSENLPNRGQVWFGDSFDTDTFEIRGRKRTVGATESFAVVAQLQRSVRAEELVLRLSWDGQVVSNEGVNAPADDEGELWGFTGGPTFQAGSWRYEFTDIGGNVLAAGKIEVAE